MSYQDRQRRTETSLEVYRMALVWGALCQECHSLAVENCPHCSKDLCESHSFKHDCDRLKARDFAIAG
jgi:hypothetical protein